MRSYRLTDLRNSDKRQISASNSFIINKEPRSRGKAEAPCQLFALLSTPSLSRSESRVYSVRAEQALNVYAGVMPLAAERTSRRADDRKTERQWDRDRQQKRLRVERQHSSCLIRFPSPSLFPFPSLFRWLASADHLAGAWEQLPPSQGHTKVCSRARWVCSDSRPIHEGSWSEAAASQKLEDRLIG